MNKFEHADEARRYLDKHLAESKRDLANQYEILTKLNDKKEKLSIYRFMILQKKNSFTLMRNKNFRIKNLDDAERQIRRLEERLRTADLEKAAIEKARKYLEEEIKKLHQ